MTIGSFYLCSFYFLSIMMFFNFGSPFLFWIMMEFNLISFILFIFFTKENLFKENSFNHILYYFLIQSMASMLFLSNFLLEDLGGIFNHDSMFLFSIIFKIGLFPLFFWVFNIGYNMGVIGLILLLTTQKIPLFMVLFYSDNSFLYYLLFLSLLVGSILVFLSNSFLYMVISSSISYSFLMYIFFCNSLALFLIFFLSYSFFLTLVLLGYKNKYLNNKFDFFMFSFFLGLPPFSLFFFKFLFTSEIFLLLSWPEMMGFWMLSFISLIGYCKFFYQSFFWKKFLYLQNEFWFQKVSMFFCTFLFFLLFTF